MDAVGIFFSEFFAIGFVIASVMVFGLGIRDMTRGAIRLIRNILDHTTTKEIRELRALELLAWTYWIFGFVTFIFQQPAWGTLILGGVLLTSTTVFRGYQLRKNEQFRKALDWITS